MKKKKFIKKAMAVLLSAAMVLSAAGCGGKTADNGTASQTAGTENPESAAAQGSGADALEPYTITWAYICLLYTSCRAAVILYAGIFKRTTNYQKGHYRKELITP